MQKSDAKWRRKNFYNNAVVQTRAKTVPVNKKGPKLPQEIFKWDWENLCWSLASTVDFEDVQWYTY